MRHDIEVHIKSCSVCGAFKSPAKKLRATLADYRVGAPLDRIGIDIVGPFPMSENGNSRILVVADYFTRWVEAFPLPDERAETTAQILVMQFLSRLGMPLEIHSDQGRNFESVLFKEVCDLVGATKTRTTPYHPSSNGLVERFNKTLVKMIVAFVKNNQKHWDKYIPLLTAAYRSTVHPSTGFTPNLMMLGREVHLPVDLLFPRPAPEEAKETHEYVRDLRERMEECYHLARENLKKASQRQLRDHDSRCRKKLYKVGDLVYRLDTARRKGKCAKLQQAWKGPLVVIEVHSPLVYTVSDRKKRRTLHHDRLKPYNAAEVPRWVQQLQRKVKPNHGKTGDKN